MGRLLDGGLRDGEREREMPFLNFNSKPVSISSLSEYHIDLKFHLELGGIRINIDFQIYVIRLS